MKPVQIDEADQFRQMPATAPQEIRGVEVHTRHVLDANGFGWNVAEFKPTEDELRMLLAGQTVKLYVFGRAWPLVFPMVGPIAMVDDVHMEVPDPMNSPDVPRIVRP